MTLGIMQPYFFPYLGYFALIYHSDKWIVFDTPQFIRHGWLERNRILSNNGGWNYIRVPLEKHRRAIAIKDIQIRNNEKWVEKIQAQLAHYKRHSKYYDTVIDIVISALNIGTKSLVELNVNILDKVCRYLNIEFDYQIFSSSSIEVKAVAEPDEWALRISKAMRANGYLNPPGGRQFFKPNKYRQEGIDLYFLNPVLEPYFQPFEFVEGLSIIDAMMFNSPAKIKEIISQMKIEKAN